MHFGKVLHAVTVSRLNRLLRPHRVLTHSIAKPLSPERKPGFPYTETYIAGKHIYGFTVKEIQEVPELCLTAIRLTHDSTGADYLHVARDDRNNVFSVGFRTTPMDSTGVPHILEHTVLCGSEKYPCRDPFFKMLNRSLATYMNALTSCDYTMYPFATQNLKDFQNLMSVYLDAVFHPCLREMDFSQEGWRLGYKETRDKSSDIIFKGIVFNEMKGAFANSDQLFAQKMLNNLLPSHTYAHVSGGDPLSIPDLTWKNLCEFHGSHYHPSNAKFYTYGDFPLEGHLQLINEQLKKFTKISINTSIPKEARWNQPRSASLHCRPDPLLPNPNKNTTVCRSYLLTDITDVYEVFTLQILSALLVDGPNSPFYKNLLEPQIGSNYAPVTGIDGSIKEAIFSVGLQGIHSDDAAKVLGIIDKTFDEIISSGFPEERIEAFLHRIELAIKHVTTNFGLNLGMGLMPTWIHDGDPIETIQLNHLVNRFRTNLKNNPKYLQEKVQQFFKENRHNLTLVMTPDVNYEKEQALKEEGKLRNMIKTLTEKDKADIYEKGLTLESKQNQEENISCLPSLKISDIDRTMKFHDIKTVNLGEKIPLQCTAQPTNGITYFRGIIDTRRLSPELKSYLPIFCHILTNLGAGKMDYKQLSQQIELKTGGLNVNTHICDNPLTTDEYEEGIRIYSHCLDHNIDDMFHLWNEIFQRVRFEDKDRMRTLINMLVTDIVSHIPDVAHSYAISQASSSLTAASFLRDQFSGMKQVSEIRKLAEKQDLEEMINIFQQISRQILDKSQCRFSLNASENSLSYAQKKLEELLMQIPKSTVNTLEQDQNFQRTSINCYYVLPFPVHYVGKCIPGVPFIHQNYASLKVLAQLMTNKFLHKEIREKGGAYGGGANHSSTGIFTFYSYRDPNNVETLEAFNKAIVWAQEGKYTDEHIDEAKLSVFQAIDRPISPGNVGETLFTSRISEKMIQEHREQLFKVKKSDLVAAASQYLVQPKHVGTCILGPENSNFKNDPSWKIITEYKEL